MKVDADIFYFYRSTNRFKQYFSLFSGFLCISSKVTTNYRKINYCLSQMSLIITHEEGDEFRR